MDFLKVIYENVEKKIISQQTSISMDHRHFEVYEVLFCTYCKG